MAISKSLMKILKIIIYTLGYRLMRWVCLDSACGWECELRQCFSKDNLAMCIKDLKTKHSLA